MAGWDLSCPGWEKKLAAGTSLVPKLPLDLVLGDNSVKVFDRLRLPDVPQTPTLAEAGGEWFKDIVRALFGSLGPDGKRMIRELFLLVPKKSAKALALDTPIATPAGFKTMGEIGIGDEVFDSDGKVTKVVEKSQVFIGRDCYEVEFSTGEKVICDADHLWVTDAHVDRQKYKGRKVDARKIPRPTAKSTAEIAASVKVGATLNNHRTAICGSLDLPDAELPIPPYVLGAWLGDGNKNGAGIASSRADGPYMVEKITACGHSARINRYDNRGNGCNITIAEPGSRSEKLPYRFSVAAKKLGLIGNKHIPQIYLRGSREQRLELLRGLMDTDGTIGKDGGRGGVSFCTTLRVLRDGFVELVSSLGFKPNVNESKVIFDGRDLGLCWKISFFPFDRVAVFALPRKLARQKASTAKNSPRSKTRQIVAVRRVDSVPTQCIAVESQTHQFLITRSLLPTHNTTQGALMMVTALLLNLRPRAVFLLTAPVQDVSDLAFAQASGAIALDEVLQKKLHVREHLKTIVHRETKAELRIMTFDPTVLTGQKPVGVLIDELHVVAKMPKAASAIRQLRGGMLPFPEAFLAFITTQSEEPPSGVFKAELEKARRIRDGEQRGAMLPVLYEFPRDMQQDPKRWKDPANWKMVTPNAGRSVEIDRLVEEFETAEATSQEELRAWASQHLNVQIGIALKDDRWTGADFWEKGAIPNLGAPKLTLEELLKRSEVVCIGIDGGGLDDMLALCVLGREEGTTKWLHWVHAWIHPIALERRKSEASRYRDFEEDGDLTIVEKIGDDLAELTKYVDQVEASDLLFKVGVDAAGISSIVDAVRDEVGVEQERIIGVPQGWRLVGAIKTTERKLAGKELIHGGTRLMNYAVSNAKAEARGNAVLITKQVAGTAKIDPLMATFDAVALMSLNPRPLKRKYDMLLV